MRSKIIQVAVTLLVGLFLIQGVSYAQENGILKKIVAKVLQISHTNNGEKTKAPEVSADQTKAPRSANTKARRGGERTLDVIPPPPPFPPPKP